MPWRSMTSSRQILRGVGDDGDRASAASLSLAPDERRRARNVERRRPDVVGSTTDLKRRVLNEVPRADLQRRVRLRRRDARARSPRVMQAHGEFAEAASRPACTSAATACSRPPPRRPCACATASACSPTVRSRRPRSSSAATTCSSARTSTRRSSGRHAFPERQDGSRRGAPDHRLRGGRGRRSHLGGHRLNQTVLVDRLFRRESGQAVAVLARILGDLDRAEEAVQDAFLIALERWPERGLPDNPAAWIVTAARNRALDRIRTERRWAGRRIALEAELRALGGDEDEETEPVSPIPDERLRLIFTTCHPALGAEARVGLTLRALGGLTTAEVGARVPDLRGRDGAADRARQGKNRGRGNPLRDPARRRPAGAAVAACSRRSTWCSTPATGRRCAPSCARRRSGSGGVLVALMPDEGEAIGLLALMLLQRLAARRARGRGRPARPALRPGPLALGRGGDRRGRGARRARLAAPPARAVPAPGLDRRSSTRAARTGPGSRRSTTSCSRSPRPPIVALNRAVAIAERDGPEAGLALMDGLRDDLGGYHLLHAARADLLRRLERRAEAAAAYRDALALTDSPVERDSSNAVCRESCVHSRGDSVQRRALVIRIGHHARRARRARRP